MTMLQQFFEAVLEKVVEYYVSVPGLKHVSNIKDFEQNLENLQKNLVSLSAKAFDVDKNGEDSGGKKMKREVEEWLEEVKEIEKEVGELVREAESKGFIMRFIKRFLDGGKAARLYEQVEKLLQQCLNFGDVLLTNEMVGKDFNENLERILKLLEDRQVSMIGLYGMGGVGKTTLAKDIYNRLVREYDGRVVWVTVSQEFTIKSLQDKIARFIGVKLDGEDEEAIRAAKLGRILSEKKVSVLILDDMWEKIDMKRVGCKFAMGSCRLIVTTRSIEVCRRIDCDVIIPVVKFGKDEAWKLFTETLEKEAVLGPEVEEIAKSMAEMCDGLPLGIITVAGSMKGETAIHKWENVATELKDCVAGRQYNMGEVDEVFQVLKYSFDWLKRNDEHESNEFNRLQLCFLYCSLYPKDYEIERGHLIRRFISEGLLDERSRRSQVKKGHSILDMLVNLCLLETCVNYKMFKCVKMHDLVRSMALKICKGKYMVRAGETSLKEIPNQEEWTKDLEKVSLLKCGIESIGEGVSPDCPKLSTLLLWGNGLLKFIPDSFFSKMQGLCTLDLCGNDQITMLPNSVAELKSLKSLLLEDCKKLKNVPNLGRLKALRELNLSRTSIEEVPRGLEELRKLRFFSIDAPQLKLFPKGLLPKLGHLEHLNLPSHLQVEIEEMENLKQLEVFSGGVKNVSDFNCFITNHGTCSYSLRVGSKVLYRRELEKDLGRKDNELVLYGSNVRDENVLGKGIVYLKIGNCEGLSKCFVDDLASRFDNPTWLKRLEIEYCEGIECIWRSDLHGVGLQISETLETIWLEGLNGLKGLMMMHRGKIRASTSAPAQLLVFSSLKKLRIYKCHKMRKLGLPISTFPNLESIHISYCEEIEVMFEDEGRDVVATLPKLKVLWLFRNPRLRKVGLAASGLPNLKWIHIECGEIEEIFKEDEGRDALTKLEKLKLNELPRLRKLGLPLSRAPNIEEITIEKCGIEEIFKEDEGRDLIATLPRLRYLWLSGNPRLRKVGLPTSAVPNLERIDIKECEEIEEIFKADEGRDVVTTLPKLEKLWLSGNRRLVKVGLAASGVANLERIDIWDCGELEEIFKEEEGRDVVATLPRFTTFVLEKMPRLRKLGLPLSRAPNLEIISIKDCLIEEIFDEDEGRDVIVTTFSKIQILKLYNLPRVKKLRLPVSRFLNLERIDIMYCTGIEEIFKEEDEGRDAIATLPKLKLLQLLGNRRMRKVGLTASGVPNLEIFIVVDCGEIEEIFKEDEGRGAVATLPKLTSFGLQKMPRLRELGLPLSRAPNLENFIIVDCGEIEEIFKEDEGRGAVATLPKLTSFSLEKMPRLRKLGLPLSRAPNLEHIAIDECGIEEIFEEDKGRDVVATTYSKMQILALYNLPRVKKLGIPASALPNLEKIDIRNCEEIEEIFKEEDEGRDVISTIPKLKLMLLLRNPRLRKVGLAASGVPNIEKIYIELCGEIEEILKEEDEGRAASIVTTLHNFRILILDYCPRLRRVSNATMICNSIEQILIRKCPRLMKKLPVDMTDAPPPSLRNLIVEREWWESLEWDWPELPQLFEPILDFS